MASFHLVSCRYVLVRNDAHLFAQSIFLRMNFRVLRVWCLPRQKITKQTLSPFPNRDIMRLCGKSMSSRCFVKVEVNLYCRILENGARGPLTTSILPLPPLEPPIEDLIALLSAPAAAQLHAPFTLSVTVRNRHTTKSANIFIQLDADPSDSFILAGLRSGRIPILLPDSEAILSWRAIPVECGYVKLPRIIVKNLRSATAGATEDGKVGEGQPVKLVKARAPHRSQTDLDWTTVLVLPN